MDWGSVYKPVNVVLVCHIKERTESEGEAVDLPVDLHFKHHLCSRALGSDRKNKITNTSGGN